MDFLKNTWQACVTPARYFEENQPSSKRALLEVLILLGIFLILIFITAFINYEAIVKTNLAATAFKPGEDTFKKFFPWNFLTYPLIWIVYIILVGLIRHGATIFLGEKTRSLDWSWFITSYALRPLLIITGLLHITNNLFPYANPASLDLRMIFTNTFLFGAWLLEGWVCVKGFRLKFEQNFGRAFLTWLSHFFLAFSLGWLGLLFYFLFIQ